MAKRHFTLIRQMATGNGVFDYFTIDVVTTCVSSSIEVLVGTMPLSSLSILPGTTRRWESQYPSGFFILGNRLALCIREPYQGS